METTTGVINAYEDPRVWVACAEALQASGIVLPKAEVWPPQTAARPSLIYAQEPKLVGGVEGGIFGRPLRETVEKYGIEVDSIVVPKCGG